MDCNSLAAFRQGLYACFQTAGDALMNTTDALLTSPDARSVAALSLSPHFTRRWPSLYAGLQDGQIDRPALRRLFATALPSPSANPSASPRWILGVDASALLRPSSPTARDRTYLPTSDHARTAAGWSFSTLAVLPQPCSSWSYTLDNQRIRSDQTPAQVAAEQLAAVVPLLPALPSGLAPLLLGDRYYGSAAFLQATQQVPCDKLLRLQGHRVFYRAAPPPTGQPGAPHKDGARFKCSDPTTHGTPDQQWQGTDAKGRAVAVACWHDLHLKACRQVPVSVLRVTRHSARDTKRDPRTSWFLWQSQARNARPAMPLPEIPVWYSLRFGIEHSYRYDKSCLLWDKPRLRTPEQLQTWTDVVAAARNQLVLARQRHLLAPQPWERATVDPSRRAGTPQQVRRALGPILGRLGTPARVCQPRGKSPGRRPGVRPKPAPRFAVVKKTPPKPKTKRVLV